ncbi:hypothetical protein GDO78_000004 [Eleutherodactylus coqui]|uniref:Uncharacterized protein n=1 Tax=Eleutherodactylus coqui TaxID=57060 RepID=A0A8J6FPU6_ELECQ|nr:hypothetical protein GDO78_000004 [Eleutherodactylus coqui]
MGRILKSGPVNVLTLSCPLPNFSIILENPFSVGVKSFAAFSLRGRVKSFCHHLIYCCICFSISLYIALSWVMLPPRGSVSTEVSPFKKYLSEMFPFSKSCEFCGNPE